MINKSTLDAAATVSALSSLWLTLTQVSLVLAIIASIMSIVWLGIRFWEYYKGRKDPGE